MGNINNNDIRNNNDYNKNRHRKIILFNHPFCKLLNINMGKYILNSVDKN